MTADAPSLSLSWFDEMEKRLLADVEMVRQMKLKLQPSAFGIWEGGIAFPP